jgi:hypothetical protein
MDGQMMPSLRKNTHCQATPDKRKNQSSAKRMAAPAHKQTAGNKARKGYVTSEN